MKKILDRVLVFLLSGLLITFLCAAGVLLFFLPSSAIAAPGDISTVAGGGVGDGGQGTNASVYPYGVAVDTTGNIYIADTFNNRIRKVDTSGIITTVAGNGIWGYGGDNGPATSANLAGPYGVAVDTTGNIYIADTNNNRIRKVNTSGIITTVAGNGTAGYGGDNGPATSASLYSPNGVAVDTSGNIYIADSTNGRIRKVDTSGIITTVAGNGTWGYAGDNGPATSASLAGPYGVAVDSTGNIYFADNANSRIRKVNTSGIITTVAGNGIGTYAGDNGPATSASLNSPTGVAVDTTGNIYIADRYNNRIREVNTSGIITTVAGNGISTYGGDNGPATSASLYNPYGVAVDTTGNIYIADYSNNRIRKVNISGIITTFAGTGTGTYAGDNGQATSARINHPDGVAVDSTGNIYIADSYNNRIRKVDTSGIITTVAGNGITTYAGDSGPATSASINQPYGVAVDTTGNIYIADSNNHRIRKVDTSGIITTFAGNGITAYAGDNGPATSASLFYPTGVAVDSTGNIYIADLNNNRIRKVDTSGIITTVAGNGIQGYAGDTGPAISASLNYPYGVAVDTTGNIYIVDSLNNRIRKVDTSGIITTVAGNGTFGYAGDNGPATSARVYYPYGITVDTSGNIYIADTNNHRIRKVNISGIITTVAGNGIGGYAGDNGPATSARISAPNGVAVDTTGNVYLADTDNDRIRMVSNTPPPPCTYSITPTSATFLYIGGPGTINVTAPAGCAWNISTGSLPPSMTITSALSGTGNGTITYTISQITNGFGYNTGFTLLLEGVTFNITQAGDPSCIYSITPTSQNFPGAGGSGTISMTAPAGCTWNALVGSPGFPQPPYFWITISSGSSGIGNGTVNYAVAPSSDTSARSGFIGAAAQTFNINQAAGVCPSITLLPSTLPNGVQNSAYSQTVSASGGTAPYTYSLVGIPDLLIDPVSGLISGMPTTFGPYSLTVTATDHNGCAASQTYNIQIATGACTTAPSGLVGWWQAENNANDALGVNNGTLVNGTTFATGKVGQAFSFGGSGDYMRVSGPVGLPTGGVPRTMMLWFKTPISWVDPYNYNVIINYGDSSAGGKFGLYLPDYYSYALSFWGETRDLSGTTPLQSDTWYHGAVTYDGSTISLYLNGQLENSQALVLNTQINANGLTVGGASSPDNITSQWTGLADEVQIYNRALSAPEVQAIYNAGSSGICLNTTPGAFTFTALNGVVPGAIIESNVITVTGVSFPVPISITGGEYAISADGGTTWEAWAVTSGMVAAGSQVKVRQTSSVNPLTTTVATLTISGLSGQFFVTTAAIGTDCTYTLSPSSQSVPSAGGSFSIDVVATAPGCIWTATTTASWIAIVTGGATGNGTVTYNISANNGPQHTGAINIGGQAFSVTQLSGCTFTIAPLSPNPADFAATGGSGTFGVSASNELCGWTSASGDTAWLTTTGSGTGSTTGSYTVLANTGGPRSATIAVGGSSFTVNQGAGCAFILTPSSQSVPLAGGSFSIDVVATAPGCVWTATTTDSWITGVTGGATGNGTVTYNVAENIGLERTGSIIIGGQAFSVMQVSGPVVMLTSTSRPGGKLSPEGQLTATIGTSQTFYITPDPGYVVTDVIVDGMSMGPMNALTLMNLTDNHTISVSFGAE